MDLDVLAARVAPVSERARGALGHKAVAWLSCAPAPLRRRRRLGYSMQGHPILLLGYSAQESAHDRGHTPGRSHGVPCSSLSDSQQRHRSQRHRSQRPRSPSAGHDRRARAASRPWAWPPRPRRVSSAVPAGRGSHTLAEELTPRRECYSGRRRRSRPAQSSEHEASAGRGRGHVGEAGAQHTAAAAHWAEGDALAAEHARRSPRASWGR